LKSKVQNSQQGKLQRILNYFAMLSFGYGLTACFNELLGIPFLGISAHYERLMSYLFAYVMIVPLLLISIAWLIGVKQNSSIQVLDLSNQLNSKINSNYVLIIIVGSLAAYLIYSMISGKLSDPTYDFYYGEDSTNCNSPYTSKPAYSANFTLKKETNEIFMIAEYEDNGMKKKVINKLDDCNVFDANNWTCGGLFSGAYQSPKYMYVSGDLSYDAGVSSVKQFPNCQPKIVRR